MKRISSYFLIISFSIIVSCKVFSYPPISEPAVNATKLKLKGWQGIGDKRVLTFGGYYTKDHYRGLTSDNTSLFFPSLTEKIHATKKVRFQQHIPTGEFCDLKANEILYRKGVHLDELADIENANHVIYEHKMSGFIKIERDSVAFEIDLSTGDEQQIFKNSNYTDLKLSYFSYEEEDNSQFRTITGSDFIINGEVVAAFRQGKDGALNYERCWVWLNNEITTKNKLIIASLISLLADQNNIDIHGKL